MSHKKILGKLGLLSLNRSLRKDVINIEICKMTAKMWRDRNSISKCERALKKKKTQNAARIIHMGIRKHHLIIRIFLKRFLDGLVEYSLLKAETSAFTGTCWGPSSWKAALQKGTWGSCWTPS